MPMMLPRARPKPQCEPFRKLLAHPKLLPTMHGLLGKGYRMDHLPFLIAQNKGCVASGSCLRWCVCFFFLCLRAVPVRVEHEGLPGAGARRLLLACRMPASSAGC